MEEEEKKKGLKKDFKIKVTEFAEIPNDIVTKMIKQETFYSYPKGYVPPDDFEPKPIKEENWYDLFNYPKVMVDKFGQEKPVEEKPVRGPSPDILITDDKDFIKYEEEAHKVYKFEVIFVNLGDDYCDDPKEEIEHFIKKGLNRWSPMNAIVMISDVRERIIDWESEEAQEIYNRPSSTFEEWNKIFVMEDFIINRGIHIPNHDERIREMREKWGKDLDE